MKRYQEKSDPSFLSFVLSFCAEDLSFERKLGIAGYDPKNPPSSTPRPIFPFDHLRIKSRRDPDSQSGMLGLRAFSVGHFAAKLAWSFPISLSNSSRKKTKSRSCTPARILSACRSNFGSRRLRAMSEAAATWWFKELKGV